jgi:hypothetical protein
MQTIKAYLYPIIIQVQIPDPTIFTVRNRIVYSQPIKVYQGIDNPVQILLMNQDNKPIDLTGCLVQVCIQDTLAQETVATYTVDWTDATKGRGTIVFDRARLDELDQRFYKLTIKKINTIDSETVPAYIDANYGVPLDLEVLPGYTS